MVSKDSNLIFLMPPKTASNSLRDALLSSKIKFDDFDPNYHKPNTHLYLSELVENFKIENVDDYKIIQIYRNPYEKFKSAFYHLTSLIDGCLMKPNLGLNEFVIQYRDCILSDDYVKCMYKDPEFVYDSIRKKINFGFTRYFVEQYKWNDLNKKVHYLDISKIDTLSEVIGYELPKIWRLNKMRGQKEELNENSMQIIFELYDKDFNLI